MAPSNSNAPGKRPVDVDDDADMDDLDGADFNKCTTKTPGVIHRTRTLDRCTRRFYPEPPRETRTPNDDDYHENGD